MSIFDIFRKDSATSLGVKSYAAGLSNPMASFELDLGSYDFSDAQIQELARSVKGLSPRRLWETQHSVRMVIDFLARNIAQLGIQTFQRTEDGGRERLRNSPVSKLLSAPNAQMTTYDLVASLISDIALFDQAWWLVRPVRAGGWEIRPLSVDRVVIVSGSEMDGNLVVAYRMTEGAQPLIVKQEQLLHFRGWDPGYGKTVSPAVDTLRNVLAEQVASEEFRLKIWENGGQISQYIARPKDAANWSDEAAKRFGEGMEGYRAGGGMEGKMPVLEDGMTINQTRFNAKDEQWAEAAQLALETVARAWHINPAMLGATGGVSYANVREFRKMLYGETLGPWLRMIQDRLNRFLLPMVGEADGVYLEFNVKSKLAASFDEQAAVMSSAVGRPWMTANEARALENMTALEGDANELVTPLNVIVGGQASPRDSAPKNVAMRIKAAGILVKAEADAESSVILAQILTKYFERQRSSVLGKIGAGDESWWDGDRWDKELADDLFKVAVGLFGRVGAKTLRDAGFGADELDGVRAEAFLKAVSESRARMVNATTQEQLEAAKSGEPTDAERSTPEGVFDLLGDSRGSAIATTLLTTFAAFSVIEAAKQVSSGSTKTWVTNSKSPRSAHAALSGVSVPVGEKFPNGADWPGDPSLGADGVAGCQCSVQVSIQ